MDYCKLTVHIQPMAGTVDPLRLLNVLTQQRGDIAVLHSGVRGNAVLAVEPIAKVVMTANAGKLRVHGGGIAESGGAGEEFDSADQAWRRWQEKLSGISFSQPTPDMVGWLGWISYEAGVMAELPGLYDLENAEIPLAHWQLFERYFIFHADAQQWYIVVLRVNQEMVEGIVAEMQAQIHSAQTVLVAADSACPSTILRQADAAAFKTAVRRCGDYIAAGDIYQANISAGWTLRVAETGPVIFSRLAEQNPAQFAAFMRYGEHELICASPELFLKRRGQMLETRPIKGTRPRDIHNTLRDQQRHDELLNSEKDQAELAMIIDLLRNDLGRVCTNVRVAKIREIEPLPALWHTHGVVTGQLPPRACHHWGDIIMSMCPGGSITGVPKIRAMEIIHELEGENRGIYCGNIGWISPSGDGMLNIAIRTIHVSHGIAHIRSGAGITADSSPDEEYSEILAKAAALLAALTPRQ